MLYTLHATYLKHDLYADFSLRLKRLLREFSCDRFTVERNEISHCSDFDSLLLKHESQMFHLRYTCVLQSISSLITSTCVTVLLSYTDDVFN